MTDPLEGLRVLEIAGPFSNYAGKLLADFGADVILVEAPGGTRGRSVPPFIHDKPGVEQSLDFAYFNSSKRGITLQLDTADGQDLFRRLAADAHAILDSEPVGVSKSRGLDYPALSAANAALVYTSITPFGADGPDAHIAATDLTLMATGGLLWRGGYLDGSPVRAGGNQANLAASQFAAVGTMLALLAAESSGLGQWVDVSAQECVVMAHENAIQFYDLEGKVRGRGGEEQRQAGIGIYPCSDGDIYLLANGLGPFWSELVSWLEAEHVEGVEALRDPKWQVTEFAESSEGKAGFSEIFGTFSLSHTKAELYEGAKQYGIPLCPVNTPADLVESPHLADREYFVDFKHKELDAGALMPGAPFHMSSMSWQIRSPAPTVGQHNADVFAELGLESHDIVGLAAGAVI
jgi:benzylsuccinate CoA-transferase BbsE subunit